MALSLLLGLLLLAPRPSLSASADPFLFHRAVRTVEKRYLFIDDLKPSKLLIQAGEQLEEVVPWLLVDPQADTLHLRHSDGREIGSVSATTWAELPGSLQRLHDQVSASGVIPKDLDLEQELLRGLTRGLDKYSGLFVGKDLGGTKEYLEGATSGIGVKYRIQDGVPVLSLILSESPAHKAGLQEGDRLLAIDGMSTEGLSKADIRALLLGNAGSVLRVDLERDQESLTVELTRAMISSTAVTARKLDSGFAYVDINRFNDQTSKLLATELYRLKESGTLSKGLILDLRGNHGGQLAQALRVADAFMKKGLIVKSRSRVDKKRGWAWKETEYKASSEGFDLPIPIIVLVDDETASASEIVAGALKYADLAILLGEKTVGKASAWRVFPLRDKTQLRLTISELLFERDISYAGKGLEPDVATQQLHGRKSYLRRSNVIGPATLPVSFFVNHDKREKGRSDLDLLLAQRILADCTGPGRSELLQAAARVAGQIQSEETTRMEPSLSARGLDWRSSQEPPPSAETLGVELKLQEPIVAGQKSRIEALVTNRGATPASRVQLVLSAPESPLDRLVLPVGWIAPGATGTGYVEFTLSQSQASRSEEIEVRLLAEGLPESTATRVKATSLGSPGTDSLLRGALLKGEGSATRVRIEVENRGQRALPESRVALRLNSGQELSIREGRLDLPEIAPGATAGVEQEIELKSGFQEKTLPLGVQLRPKGGKVMSRQSLPVPIDGQWVTRHRPVVSLSVEPGTGSEVRARLKVTDTGDLRDVVVELNEDKILHLPSQGGNLEREVPIVLKPGKNLIEVKAMDEDGLRGTAAVIFWGG